MFVCFCLFFSKLTNSPHNKTLFLFCSSLYDAACLGVSNLNLAGKYFNGSISDKMTEDNDMAILGTDYERCNWDWGHAQMCQDGVKVDPNGDPVMVKCRLCFTCREGFKKMGRARCKICPETTTNRALLVVGAILVVAAGVSVVFLSIASAGSEAEISEGVKKIGINFLQICSLAALFPLKWPKEVETVFAMMNAVSSPAQHLLSPDCELSWMSSAEAFYNKQIGFSILPMALVVISMFLWLLAYCIHAKKSGRSSAYYYDRTVLTMVCILFLLYPTMVKQSLAALACEPVGNIYYLAADLQEECFVGRHLYYVFFICIPQIFAYTIGMPCVATLVLRRHRHDLGNMRVRFRYGILFNGYRPRLYWWELTIAFRKVVLVLIAGIYGTRLGPDMQVVVALMMVMLFIVSHLMFEPFSAEDQRLMKELPSHVLKKQNVQKQKLKTMKKRALVKVKSKHLIKKKLSQGKAPKSAAKAVTNEAIEINEAKATKEAFMKKQSHVLKTTMNEKKEQPNKKNDDPPDGPTASDAEKKDIEFEKKEIETAVKVAPAEDAAEMPAETKEEEDSCSTTKERWTFKRLYFQLIKHTNMHMVRSLFVVVGCFVVCCCPMSD